MHPLRGLDRRHDPDVVMRARCVNCVTSLRVDGSDVLGMARACHDAPLEKSPRTAKRQNETASFGRW
eukprot:2189031-Pleurochrysis_carterae.AAC.1